VAAAYRRERQAGGQSGRPEGGRSNVCKIVASIELRRAAPWRIVLPSLGHRVLRRLRRQPRCSERDRNQASRIRRQPRIAKALQSTVHLDRADRARKGTGSDAYGQARRSLGGAAASEGSETADRSPGSSKGRRPSEPPGQRGRPPSRIGPPRARRSAELPSRCRRQAPHRLQRQDLPHSGGAFLSSPLARYSDLLRDNNGGLTPSP